jgi:3-deoxy-D-manno-octulosonate 8-phosphate phosphatase (KDO 8-P phosphatase)
MEQNFKERLHHIKCFAFDVDGVLTNGQVFITAEGDLLRSMNIKDGYALELAIKKGYQVIIISGAKQTGVVERLKRLGVVNVFAEVKDKLKVLTDFLKQNNLLLNQTVFMGDDMPDIVTMQSCGVAACPIDAVHDVKGICSYVSPAKGGEGAARDIIEQVLRLHGNWQ